MEGICPTNDCGCDVPFVSHVWGNTYSVGCSKCHGYVSYYISNEDDAYMDGIDVWMAVTKEMSKSDRDSRIHSEDDVE